MKKYHVLFLFFIIQPLAAADSSDVKLYRRPILNYALTRAGNGAPESDVTGTEPKFQLRAGKDSGDATLTWGTPTSDEDLSSLTFTSSAPLDKDNDNTTLTTLNGFANSFWFETKFIKRLWGPAPTTKDLPAFESRALSRMQDLGRFKNASDLKTGQPQLQRYLEQAATAQWLGGVSAKVGYKEFTYLDGTTVEERKRKTTPYGGRVFVARFLDEDMLLSLSYEYQHAFKDAKKKSLVVPSNTTPQEVRTGPVGRPKDDPKRLFSLEFRKRMNILSYSKGSVALKATYDQNEGVFGVSVPIHFIEGDDAGEKMSGGIELGWVNHKEKDKDKFTIGVIVGSLLSFIPALR